jgi:lysophospholipase L1-like esterase
MAPRQSAAAPTLAALTLMLMLCGGSCTNSGTSPPLGGTGGSVGFVTGGGAGNNSVPVEGGRDGGIGDAESTDAGRGGIGPGGHNAVTASGGAGGTFGPLPGSGGMGMGGRMESGGGAGSVAPGGVGGRGGAGGGIGGSSMESGVAAGVRWLGRVDTTDASHPRFGWSGTGFIAALAGDSLNVQLNNTGPFVFKAVIDGVPQPAFTAVVGQRSYSLVAGLAAGTHTVALYRQTEGVYGDSQFVGLTVGGGALVAPPPASGRLIEIVGASVSCGYGDLGTDPCGFTFATESHFDTYESVAARAVNADLSVVAISGRGIFRNFDGTTDGTMPKLYDRILVGSAVPTWDFHATPQAVVINLGKNDFALGDPGASFRDAYLAFARALRVRYPSALIVCATGPNLGAAAHAGQVGYVNQVIATRRSEGDAYIELLDWPEQVAGEIGCDFHPNAAKQKLMGDALTARLRAVLGW